MLATNIQGRSPLSACAPPAPAARQWLSAAPLPGLGCRLLSPRPLHPRRKYTPPATNSAPPGLHSIAAVLLPRRTAGPLSDVAPATAAG